MSAAGDLVFGPDYPDPAQTAATQGQFNKDALLTSAAINQINQQGPGYNINWGGTIGDPNRTMSYELDPWREALANQMGMFALDQSSMLGGPVDYSGVASIPGSDVPAYNVDPFNPKAGTVGDFSSTAGPVQQFTPGGPNVSYFSSDAGPVGNFDWGDQVARSQEVEGTMYDALMSRINPDLDRNWREQTTMAAAKGLPMGGEAWNDVQESLNRQRQDATMGAAGQAIGMGRDELARLFGQEMAGYQANLGAQGQRFGQDVTGYQQNLGAQGQQFGQDIAGYQTNLGAQGQQFGQDVTGFQQDLGAQGQRFGQALDTRQQNVIDWVNQMQGQQQGFGQGMAAHQQGMSNIGFDRNQVASELAMMLNANPYNQTQIQQPSQYQMAAPDYSGLVNANAQQQAANQASMIGGLANLGGAALISDRRLKHNINQIGYTEAGVPTYEFSYNGSDERYIGVMAQDLLFTQPEAVITGHDGYMMVDYSKVH